MVARVVGSGAQQGRAPARCMVRPWWTGAIVSWRVQVMAVLALSASSLAAGSLAARQWIASSAIGVAPRGMRQAHGLSRPAPIAARGESTGGLARGMGIAARRCVPTPGERNPAHIAAPPRLPSRITVGPTPDLRARARAVRGERLIITGTVSAENCRPLAGAVIYVVQTNAAGEYGPGGDSYYMQGTLRTDAWGHYEIVTVKPGHYKGAYPPPPAHIHFNVSHPAAAAIGPELRFAGDPALRARGAFNPEAVVIALIHERGPHGPYLHGVFNIVLPNR